MAKVGFGQPKTRRAAEVFICPTCGGKMARVKSQGTMKVSCHSSAKKISSFEGSLLITGKFEKTHNNFDAGCDISLSVKEARKTCDTNWKKADREEPKE